MKKTVFTKSVLRVLPLGLLFIIVGLTSCNNDISEDSNKEKDSLVISDSLNGQFSPLKSVEKLYVGEKATEVLNKIFDENNPLLKELETQKAYVIKSEEDLMQICPKQVDAPSLDFEGKCLVFASIETTSISDEILNNSLMRVEDEEEYEFHVVIQKCRDCWTAIGKKFPYGLYDVESDSIKSIILKVEEPS